MKDTAFEGLWIVVLVFGLFVWLSCSGCSHQYHAPEAYLDNYYANRIDYDANNKKEDLVKSNKNWNMYLSARSWDANSAK